MCMKVLAGTASFDWLEKNGPVERDEMYETFNMGLGMRGVVSAADIEKVIKVGKGCR